MILISLFRDIAKYEVVGHQFVDLSDNKYGAAIMNNCKYGHSVINNVVGLSLLKSSKGPNEIADMRVHEFTYALYPHLGIY